MLTTDDLRPHAIARLIDRTGPRAFRVAFDLVRDRAEAEDIVQEALASTWVHFARLHAPNALEAWFMRIVTNLALRVLRRRRMKDKVLRWFGIATTAEGAGTGAETADPSAALDLQLARTDDERRLQKALAKLPAMQRAALILRYGNGLSVAEVANSLGIGIGTAKTHLHRGLVRLRDDLPAGS